MRIAKWTSLALAALMLSACGGTMPPRQRPARREPNAGGGRNARRRYFSSCLPGSLCRAGGCGRA